MKTLAILQARMGSRRFPGKVLSPIEGLPMILRQLERISRANSLDEIVIATSTEDVDNRLAEVVRNAGFAVVRGSLDNVFSRFIDVLNQYPSDSVVRLTADCPLISWRVIDEAVSKFHDLDVDYLSNTLLPTYPDGLDVEVVKSFAFRRLESVDLDSAEKEHVTLGIYRRQEQFSLANIQNQVDLSHMRLTVDTPEDFRFVSEIYAQLYRKSSEFELDEIVAFLDSHPEVCHEGDVSIRNAALAGLDTGAMTLPQSGEQPK